MSNTQGTPNSLLTLQKWEGEQSTSFVSSGGLASGWVSLTLSAFATNAFITQTSYGVEFTKQAAATVGPFNAGNGLYWVALHMDVSTVPAGWTRQTGTHYIWQKSATRPATATGSIMLFSVTVSAGAITTILDYRIPQSYVRTREYNVRDPLYGATGDGVTNDYPAVQACLDAVGLAGGGVMRIPAGTHLVATNVVGSYSNVTILGDGEASIIKATTGVTASIGALAMGLTKAFAAANPTDITVSRIKVDGNALCRGFYASGVTRGVFEHIWSGNSTAGALQVYLSTDCTVRHCHVENGNGQFGDGIYLESCTRPKILNNFVYDFERIGIVAEGSVGANSIDVLIDGNDIQYGHNATNPESNAGVWVENCERAYITNNRISNMTNTPGLSSRGITLGGVTPSGVPEFIVTSNRVADAQLGITVAPGSTARVIVANNTICGTGNLIGVHISSASTIQVNDCAFGPSVHTAGSHGAIVLDTTTTISRLEVSDCTITGTTYSGDSADFNIYALAGGTLSFVRLSGLHQWRCCMRAAPDTTRVTDCYFYTNTGTYWGIGATSYFNAVNCFITDTGSAGVRTLGSTAATGIYTLTNVTMTNCITQWASSSTPILYATGCNFYNCQFQINGHAELHYTGCLVNEYPSTGFIRANFATGKTLHIRFRSGEIRCSSDLTPFGLWNFQPTTLIIQDTVRSSVITTLNSMTAASTGFTVTNVLP